MIGEWIDESAVAVDASVLAAECDVHIDLPRGRYEVLVAAGTNRETATEEVEVNDEETDLEVQLDEVVDTAGWACLDGHTHTESSYDSDVPMDQRVVSALAEGLDAFVVTDHNAVDRDAIDGALADNRERIHLVAGLELSPDRWPTTSTRGHVNVYPLPTDLDPAAIDLSEFGREAFLPALRALAPDAIVQVNHPRWGTDIGYFSHIGLDAVVAQSAGGALVSEIDVLEVWNARELERAEGDAFEDSLADWFVLLNLGHRVTGTTASDSHGLARTPLGFPRTCVELPGDRSTPLSDATLVEALRSGRAFGTSGPWLEVTVDGVRPGGLAATSDVEVEVIVTRPLWASGHRATLIVNGTVADVQTVDANPWQGTFVPSIESDAWLLLIVEGDTPLGPVGGQPWLPMASRAFTNPIYIDADGDGAWTAPGPD